MANLNGKTPQQMAHEALHQEPTFDVKVKAIAERLKTSYEQAFKLVEQEQKRKEAGKRYRQSDAYKAMLAKQKLVRQMMKA